MEEDLLTIREKRLWLAEIFRNAGGEYSQADRFKALTEDTKLALIQEEADNPESREKGVLSNPLLDIISSLPPPDPVHLR